MSTPTAAPALVPYAHAAAAAGLEAWALQRLEQARFRTADNITAIGDRCYLTVAGLRALAESLRQHGYPTKAHALTVLANQQQTTPSRLLVPPAPKDAPVTHAWQRRVDITG